MFEVHRLPEGQVMYECLKAELFWKLCDFI